MANNGTPPMPMAASANMAMSMTMSKVRTTTAPKSSTETDLPSSTQEAVASIETALQADPDQCMDPERVARTSRRLASTTSLSSGSVQRKIKNREKALNMQHIQLAVQLKDEKELQKTLKTNITGLEDELTSAKFRNEALDYECQRLRNQIMDVEEKLKSLTSDFGEREKALLDRIADLESKLDSTSKSLEQSMADRNALQKAFDEVAKIRDQQTDTIRQLELDLEANRNQIKSLDDSREALQEQHRKELDSALADLRLSHESREQDLRQRLTAKGTEVKDLKREAKKLRESFMEIIAEKAIAQTDLATQKAESLKMQQSLEDLRKSTAPFAQTIVICVDISGSLSSVIHRVKQTYRDVLHIIKSNNSDAKVAVVTHGGYNNSNNDALPAKTISNEMFQILNSVGSGGAEDYIYCLDQAESLLDMNDDSKKLVILIGDGNTCCARSSTLLSSCERLKSLGIRAHSIVLPNGSNWVNEEELSMRDISEATDGRVEDEATYMSAIDEILRHEREQYFEVSK